MSNRTIDSLKQASDLSVSGALLGELDANFRIEVEGVVWNCYTVSICYRDVFCYCDKGTATFLVDSYGDRNTIELFNWETDNETK